MERRDFTFKKATEQTVLMAGISMRLAMCPGDDIALVAGSFAAGSSHEAESHIAVMPDPLELNFPTGNPGKMVPKNLR
jgi:hypothetical protein